MANAKVRGISIELGADASGVKAALAGINSSVRTTQQQLRDVNKLMRLDPTSPQLAAQKFNMLQTSISQTKSKIDTLKQAESQLKGEMQNGGTEKQQAQLAALQREIISCELNLKKFQNTVGSGSAGLAVLGAKLSDMGSKFTSMGQKITPVSAAIAAYGAASVAAFKKVDEGSKNVIYATGAVGESAQGLKEAFKNVAGGVAGDFADIGNTVGAVAVRFNATGSELESLSTQFQQFATISKTDGQSAVAGVDMALRLFNVDSSQAGNVMGLLVKAFQETGKPASELLQTLQTAGPTFKEMGLGIGGAVQLMTMYQKEGIDSTTMLTQMRKAATEFSAKGKDMSSGLKELIARLQDSSKSAEATKEAYSLFGKRAGLAFVQAAQQGKISLDGLSDSLEGYSDVVAQTYIESLTGADKIAGGWKLVQLALGEVGEVVGDSLGQILKDMATGIRVLAQGFKNLPEPVQKVAVWLGVVVSAAAPALLVFGKLTKGLGSLFSTLSKSSNIFSKAFQGIGNAISNGATKITGGGKAAEEGAKGVEKAGKSTVKGAKGIKTGATEILASAAQIIAVGGSIALAGVGFKQMADGCAEIGQAGPLAAVALAEMGGILIGFMAVAGKVGQSLSGAALGLISFGGAIAAAGVGIKLLADASVALSQAGVGAQITMAAIGAGVIGLAAALGAIGEAFPAATPFVLAFGAAVAGIGIGVGAATAGIGMLCNGVSEVIRALTDYATATGIAKQNTDEAKNAFDVMGQVATQVVSSLGNVAEGITSAFAGVGEVLHGLGLEVVAMALNDVANATDRITGSAGNAQGAIYGLSDASDSAGGALGNLAGTGQSSADTIHSAYDGLSNSIYGDSQQIEGSITNAFNNAKNNAINALNELKDTALNVFSNIQNSTPTVNVRVNKSLQSTTGATFNALNAGRGLSDKVSQSIIPSLNSSESRNNITLAIKDAIKDKDFGTTNNWNVNGAPAITDAHIMAIAQMLIDKVTKKKEMVF